MVADTYTLDRLLNEVRQLSPEYRLRLVEKIIQTLVYAAPPQDARPLRFGEFGGDESAMSTLADFTLAEWHPTDEELDGTQVRA